MTPSVTREVDEKERAVDQILEGLGSVVVAFSGGVDSAYLALRAYRVLGSHSLAVTAESPSLADDQRRQAASVARDFGFPHMFVSTGEIGNPDYTRNDAGRCYHCKVELFRHLVPLSASLGFAHVAYGLIVDDLADFRPGQRAALEAGVRSPMVDAGLTKEDVRALSRAAGLPTWSLPPSPCLASRIPYGTPVTVEALRRVEEAEARVRSLGFRELRVRHLGRRARVEIAIGELERLQDPAVEEAVRATVRVAGYDEVEIDPQGYRRGRLNDALRVRDGQSGV